MSQDSWGGRSSEPVNGIPERSPSEQGGTGQYQPGQEATGYPATGRGFMDEPTRAQQMGPARMDSDAGQFGPGAGQNVYEGPVRGPAFSSGYAPSPDHRAAQNWTQPIPPTNASQPIPPIPPIPPTNASQPIPPIPPTNAQKNRKPGTFTVLATGVLLSAVVAGGTAFGVATYMAPKPTNTVGVSPSAGQTRVIQGPALDWAGTAAKASKSAVSIQISTSRGSASGSGVVLDTTGHIVTNNHVVEAAGDQGQILVQIGSRRLEATIVGTDPSSDLAVLKLINPAGVELTPIVFADSDKLAVGDPVMAIGNPLGLSGTVTTGIVSALNRPVSTGSGQQSVVTNAIQISAAINPGNSGGALVNANGDLVGINTAIASLGQSQGGQAGNIGIGFAIESNLVKTITQQIIQKGSANHAWLGVSAADDASQTSGGAIVGAKVTQINADSPAAKAGLKVGDLITSVSGRPVSSLESLIAVIRAQDIGEEVEIGYIRDGKEAGVKVILAESPRGR